MKIKASPTVVVICATTITIVLISAYVRLAINHANTGQFLVYIGQILPGALVGVASLIKVSSTEKKVEEVKKQTNGVLSKAVERLAEAGQQTNDIEHHIDNPTSGVK